MHPPYHQISYGFCNSDETIISSGEQQSKLKVKASLKISAGTQAVVYSCAATNRAGTSNTKSVIIIVTKGGAVKVIIEKE